MSEMDKKRREAIRYLGFGRNAADERTYELIEASFDDLNREASPRFVYRIFDLDHSVDGLLRVGTMEIQSKSLLRNLKGCGQVVLFGATLGAGADRLIRPGISYRYGKGGCTPGMCCCRAGRVL